MEKYNEQKFYGKYLYTLFFVALVIGIAFPVVITSYSLDKDSYEPGENGVLNINVSYIHPLSSSERLLGFKLVSIKVIAGNFSREINLGDLPVGNASYSIAFNAGYQQEGVYDLKVEVNSFAQIEGTSLKLDPSNTATVIPLRVVTKPLVDLSVSPSIINKQGQLNLTICLIKGKAKEIEVSSKDIKIETAFFDNIKGCESKTLAYDALNLEQGVNEVRFNLKIKDITDLVEEKEVKIPLAISGWETGFIIKQQDAINYKENSVLRLNIINLERPIKNIIIKPAENAGIIFLTQNEIRVQALNPQESKMLEVNVYTDLPPGQNAVPFDISWEEEGLQKKDTFKVPLFVKAATPLEVFLSASPTPLRAGEKHTLSITVNNKASYKISSISLRLSSKDIEINDITDKVFFGSLDPDDFTTRQISITPLEPGNKTIKIEVSYIDTSGNMKNETLDFSIVVKEKEQKKDNVWIIAIAFFVVLALIYFFIFRKKK